MTTNSEIIKESVKEFAIAFPKEWFSQENLAIVRKNIIEMMNNAIELARADERKLKGLFTDKDVSNMIIDANKLQAKQIFTELENNYVNFNSKKNTIKNKLQIVLTVEEYEALKSKFLKGE